MKKIVPGLLILFFTTNLVLAEHFGPTTPENALHAYLNNGDNSFKWSVHDYIEAEGVTLYRVLFTSQTWRNIEWNHELTILVPENLEYDDALLFITGGSVKNGKPNLHDWDKEEITSFSEVAKINKSVVAILWQVPNQPLFNNLKEDALISFTFHKYQENKDLTWPLLFPMAKSAVRAMDAIQEFAQEELKTNMDRFVVSGASKRGWTTWLTGAVDPRVKAIGPMVIDMLNMPVNINYHKVAWGDFSPQIQDYVELGIAQQVNTSEGRDLVKMVDPYSYRKKLTIPKMLFMGTNDEYWPVDAVKNYIDSIPGENYICYTPNAGHGLGDKKTALAALSAFFGLTVTNSQYPQHDLSVKEKNETVVLKVKTNASIPEEAIIWSAHSKDRDFRDEEWTSSKLDKPKKKKFTVKVDSPDSGFKAFYIDLRYKAPSGNDYTQSTRMFVMDKEKLFLNR